MSRCSHIVDLGLFQSKSGLSNRDSPSSVVSRGQVDESILLAHAIDHKDDVSAESYPVLFCEPLFCALDARERLAQSMFESLDVPSLFVAPAPLLSLFACGVSSGLALDIGLLSTRIVPVLDGACVMDAAVEIPLGGQSIDDVLVGSFGELLSHDAVFALKVAHAFCPGGMPVVTPESTKAPELLPLVYNGAVDAMRVAHGPIQGTTFDCTNLAGKRVIFDVSANAKALADATQILFEPVRFGSIAPSLPHALATSVLACDPDDRPTLLANVCLAGSTTALPGFGARVLSELRAAALAPNPAPMIHVAPGERSHTTWTGGKVVSALSSFAQCWFTKAMYDEAGPFAIHRSCVLHGSGRRN